MIVSNCFIAFSWAFFAELTQLMLLPDLRPAQDSGRAVLYFLLFFVLSLAERQNEERENMEYHAAAGKAAFESIIV
jgi:hypothetical protein